MSDRVVLITGASAGIGAALAVRAARGGARLMLVGRREAELAAVAARCGDGARWIAADVTRRADVERARDAALAAFGAVDVWVNNVGRGISVPVSALTDDDVDEMVSVNLKSALYGMQAILPHLRARGRGQIVNVSSMLGRIPFVHIRSAYSAMKAALNSLTTNLRMELSQAHPGIHVTLVLPGVVSTEFGVNARGGGPDSRGLPGAQTAEEVAELIWQAIEQPRPEVYTRPNFQSQVASFYASDNPTPPVIPPPTRTPPRS